MGDCKIYSTPQGRDPRLDPLVKAMQSAGVTDTDRDSGFHQINYSTPLQWGKVDQGAGDCALDEREDLELALKDWRKFSEPLKTYYGVDRLAIDYDNVPYDLGSASAAAKKDFLLAHTRAAKKEIEKELTAAGIDPKSDEFKLKVAKGLFYWMEFPHRRMWNRFGNGQRMEILDAMAALDKIGLPGLKKYLIKNGGGNHFYDDHSYLSNSRYDPSSFNPGFYSTSAPSEFYAILEDAGLHPTLMEITPIEPDRFTCGMPLMVVSGVGIMLSSGWHFFDIVNHNADVKGGIVYPLSLRQYLASFVSAKAFGSMYVTQRPTDKEFERHFSADGLAPNSNTFTNLLFTAKQQASPVGKTLANNPLIKFFSSHEQILHPVFSLSLNLFDFKNQKLHPAIPKRGVADLVWLHGNMGSLDSETVIREAMEHAESLLKMDPNCAIAHAVLGKIGMESDQTKNDAETEAHIAAAIEAMPRGHSQTSNLYARWGAFLLRRGRIDESKLKFIAAWDQKGGDDDDRAIAAYYLSYLSARQGDASRAAEWMERAKSLMISDINAAKNAEKWINILKEWQSKHPISDAILKKDDSVARPLAGMWSAVGRVLLQYKKFEPAIDAFIQARSLANDFDGFRVTSDLQEAYLQSGNTTAAMRVWEEGQHPSVHSK